MSLLALNRTLGVDLPIALLLFGVQLDSAEVPIQPLPNAHAHNDYEHSHPLFDALDQGFCSVEADIHLVEGRLLVAHDKEQVKPERTLSALYLDPLRARAKANGGHIFSKNPNFHLLVDIKSDGSQTWPVLRDVLKEYGELLTEFRKDSVVTRAVTVILSGNTPREELAAEPVRWAGADGRLPDLATQPSPFLVPWVSDNWLKYFQWRGEGEMSPLELTKLKGIVARAHEQGRKVRFWGAPDSPALWRIECEAGVDFINTDRLSDLREFLIAQPTASSKAH